MTVPGAETSLTAGAMPIEPSATEEPPPTPFPSAPIEEMLRVLVKGVRAHQLYLHNNPTYLRALEALRAAFPPIWEYTDDFALQITESEFIWEGVAVLSEPGKTADSLPWLFYKDGVRELRLQKNFEQEDLVGLLDIIQRARRQSPDEDDLLVMLWERDLLHLRYKYVELADEGGLGIGEPPATTEPRAIEPHASMIRRVPRNSSWSRVRGSSTWRTSTPRSTSSTKRKSPTSDRRSRESTQATCGRTSWPSSWTSSRPRTMWPSATRLRAFWTS